MAIECARLHPQVKHVRRWSARLQLMRIAWKVVVGRGATPHVDATFPTATFEKLEQPLGALAPEIYRPLSRLIERMQRPRCMPSQIAAIGRSSRVFERWPYSTQLDYGSCAGPLKTVHPP